MKFVDGWLVEAKEYNINENSFDRAGVPVTHLVVHGTAGGSDGSGTMAYMKSVGVSTNFAISTDGTIWQGVSCDRAAWGNAPLDLPRFNFTRADLNPNLWTISVEFCKPDDTNKINITDAQKKSGFALIKTICETYNIPKKRGDGRSGIISHGDLNSRNRSGCPGTFPWDELMEYLANGGEQEMPVVQIGQGVGTNFKDIGGGRWHCNKTNVDFVGDNLKFWREMNGRGGLPLTPEIKLAQIGGKDASGTAIVVCERWIQIFDPKRKIDNPPNFDDSTVYLLHLDSGYGRDYIAKSLVDPLNKQIAAQKAQIDTLNHQLSTVENTEKEALQQQIADLTAKQTKLLNIVKQFVAEATALS